MIAVCLRWLLLLSFTAHAVFGCCWHHHHQADPQSDSVVPTQVATNASVPTSRVHQCCHHSDDHSTKDSDKSKSPHRPHEDCDEQACSYLLSQNSDTQVDLAWLKLSHVNAVRPMAACPRPATATLSAYNPARLSIVVAGDSYCISQSSWQL